MHKSPITDKTSISLLESDETKLSAVSLWREVNTVLCSYWSICATNSWPLSFEILNCSTFFFCSKRQSSKHSSTQPMITKDWWCHARDCVQAGVCIHRQDRGTLCAFPLFPLVKQIMDLSLSKSALCLRQKRQRWQTSPRRFNSAAPSISGSAALSPNSKEAAASRSKISSFFSFKHTKTD